MECHSFYVNVSLGHTFQWHCVRHQKAWWSHVQCAWLWVVRICALAGVIILCSWERHYTLTVPHFTQVYKCVQANLSWDSPGMDKYPILRGEGGIEILLITSCYRNKGYYMYMPAHGYEFDLQVFNWISHERVQRTSEIWVEHKKIKFISTSGHVIFCLSYKHQWKRCDLWCNHNDGGLFMWEDSMLFSCVKIWSFRVKAHLVFHWYLYNQPRDHNLWP